jgi:hypothetical protein
MAQITTMEFGFQPAGSSQFSLEFPQTIGMRHGGGIDALVLNGNQFGGHGGLNPEIIDINEDYIVEFRVRAGRSANGYDMINFLYFKTKSGQEIFGGDDPNTYTAYKNIKVLRIGGWSDVTYLFDIQIEFIQNYSESTVIERDADTILDYHTGPADIVTYEERSVQVTQSYSYTSQQLSNMTIDVSASGEYFEKFSASTHMQSQSTTTEEIQRSNEISYHRHRPHPRKYDLCVYYRNNNIERSQRDDVVLPKWTGELVEV